MLQNQFDPTETLYGTTIFKKDDMKPFTSEQIEFANSFKEVKIEILERENCMKILSRIENQHYDIACEIVQKFCFDLKLSY